MDGLSSVVLHNLYHLRQVKSDIYTQVVCYFEVWCIFDLIKSHAPKKKPHQSHKILLLHLNVTNYCRIFRLVAIISLINKNVTTLWSYYIDTCVIAIRQTENPVDKSQPGKWHYAPYNLADVLPL